MENSEGDIYLAVCSYHLGTKPETIAEYLTSALKRSKNVDIVANTLYDACTTVDDDAAEKHDSEQLMENLVLAQPSNAQFHLLYGKILEKTLDCSKGELAALIEFEKAKALGLKSLELYHSLAISMWFMETEAVDDEDKESDKMVRPRLKQLNDEFQINENNIGESLDAVLDEGLKLYPQSPQLLQLRATQEVVQAMEKKDKKLWENCLVDCRNLANLKTPMMAPNENYEAAQYDSPRLNLESYALYALGDKTASLNKAKQAFDGVMMLAQKENSVGEKNFAYATLADYYNFIDDFDKAQDCLNSIKVGDHSSEEASFRETITKESLEELLASCKSKTHWLPTFPNP